MVMINGSLDFRKVKGLMIDGLILPNEITAERYLGSVEKIIIFPQCLLRMGEVIYEIILTGNQDSL